jgi:hypothetical protein
MDYLDERPRDAACFEQNAQQQTVILRVHGSFPMLYCNSNSPPLAFGDSCASPRFELTMHQGGLTSMYSVPCNVLKLATLYHGRRPSSQTLDSSILIPWNDSRLLVDLHRSDHF